MNKAIRDLIVNLTLKALGIASGFWGYVSSIALKYIYAFLYKEVKNEKIIIEEKLETKKELNQYDQAINAPNATADEIKNAGKDFIKN